MPVCFTREWGPAAAPHLAFRLPAARSHIVVGSFVIVTCRRTRDLPTRTPFKREDLKRRPCLPCRRHGCESIGDRPKSISIRPVVV